MNLVHNYFIKDISLSYTLKTDDITKGTKPQGTPYVSREEFFDKNGYNAQTRSSLCIEQLDKGLKIFLKTESDDLSEFGLNLPFNFMGKKNAGGWTNQYLFNSPYSSLNNDIYCYLTNPKGKNLIVIVDGKADGWKLDYSLFLGGAYFDNLKVLANFDKAYKQNSNNKELTLFIFEVNSFLEGLQKVSEVKKLPILYYDKSGGKVGEKIEFLSVGKCNEISINGKKFDFIDRFEYIIDCEGMIEIVPFYNGKKGLDCSVFGYKSIQELYKKSMDAVTMEDIAYTDGNLCEHQCWVSAMLRYMLLYGPQKEYEKLIKDELAIICETDESKAVPRQTIFNRPHDNFSAYNVYKSSRVQEQLFGITILLDAYKYFKEEKYLIYAENALDCVINHYQKEDGRIETFIEWNNEYEDYSTVCSPMIPIVDMSIYFEKIDYAKSITYKQSASRLAEYLFSRGINFPTEGGITDEAETRMEEGSISCTALSLLYYCAKIEKKDKYIEKAKEILDIHDSWIIKTPIAPMYYSTLRWWETKWEGDKDGNAICCGHAWTIWRAEADYWYYFLTNNKEYYFKAYNGFMSNFAKTDKNGKSYSCYQPDYITGGGFTDNSSEVEFRIAKGFPRQSDSGLSRYVWIRAVESIYHSLIIK